MGGDGGRGFGGHRLRSRRAGTRAVVAQWHGSRGRHHRAERSTVALGPEPVSPGMPQPSLSPPAEPEQRRRLTAALVYLQVYDDRDVPLGPGAAGGGGGGGLVSQVAYATLAGHLICGEERLLVAWSRRRRRPRPARRPASGASQARHSERRAGTGGSAARAGIKGAGRCASRCARSRRARPGWDARCSR